MANFIEPGGRHRPIADKTEPKQNQTNTMNLKSILTAVFAVCLTAGPALSQIKAGRAIQIVIQGVPPEERARIDGIYPVSEAGTINMPFIGQVRAAGMMPANLQVALENIYKSQEIYTNPTFQVIGSNAESIDEQVVHIGGQVKATGQVKFIQGLTLYQAIQAAGGATEFGSMRRVKLFRGGSQRQIDLTKAENMRVTLNQGDTIEVPQKDWLGR
jgi:protein involved in polysaccharide export with SLBB domain